MTDIELGWLAGIIDGEGTISLERRGRWRQPRLSMTSTDIELCQEMKKLIGGSITPVTLHGKMVRPQWHWKLMGSQKVIDVLFKVKNHLRCPNKYGRALVICCEYNEVTRANGVYTEEEKAKKDAFEKYFFDEFGSKKMEKLRRANTAGQ